MKFARVDHDTILLGGGWDQITPALSVSPGRFSAGLNYECATNGGYTRILGYERYDGQAKPSDAVYRLVYVDAFTNTPVAGDTITGGTSGATGVVLAVGADYVAYTKLVGAFTTGETISVGATLIGTTVVPTAAVSALNHVIYTAAAADSCRADITAVPGSGSCLGGVLYGDVTYAFRANAGGTAVGLYKSSAAGWVQVPFFNEVYFTAGTNQPADGDTLTQGGVTATIQRVALESGAWLGGTAAGRFIVTTPSGGNFASGAATAGASTTITLSGVETAITLATGGKFECVIGNFTGSASTRRVYGCDGINRGFEFDGTTLVPINTGFTVDTPKHVRVARGYLMFTIGSSLTGCSPLLPYDWSAANGAWEIATGNTLTGLIVLRGASGNMSVLAASQTDTMILYGTDATNFDLIPFEDGGGAIDHTMANMADAYMMDSSGVVSLQATQAFGNFASSTITNNVQKYIKEKRTRASCSIVDRPKSQYRLFFTDGDALFITIVNGKLVGSAPMAMPNTAYQCFAGKYSDGEEASFMCTTDGYVMHMEKGTSFDGAAIDGYVSLVFNHTRSSRIIKSYSKCAVNISGGGYKSIDFSYTLGYGASEIAHNGTQAYVSNVSRMQWDAFTWDAFVWDGQDLTPRECEMEGDACNVSLTFKSGTNYTESFTIDAATLHYTLRRGMR